MGCTGMKAANLVNVQQDLTSKNADRKPGERVPYRLKKALFFQRFLEEVQ